MSKHTPGRWAVSQLQRGIGDSPVVMAPEIGAVAIVFCPRTDCGIDTTAEADANAAHIVRCVNAHDQMLAACEEWLDLWCYIREHYPDIETPFAVDCETGMDACGRLRAAIAAAKDGE